MKTTTKIFILITLFFGSATLQAQTFQWAKSFGGISDDYGFSIALDGSGNVFTTGAFLDVVDFDPGPNVTNLIAAAGQDVYIQKMDANGNFLWAKSFGGFGTDGGRSIMVDPSGNVYTTGVFEGTVDFDPGPGVNNLTSAGDVDIFIQKMDANGNFLWAKSFGGGSTDYSYSIAKDPLGNIYTCGYFSGTADFNPGVAISNLNSAGGTDVFVQKLDLNGNFIWAQGFGSPSDDQGLSITIDASSNVYTTGPFYSTVDFDPGPGVSNLTANGNYDVFVQKMNSGGNFLWARAFGGTLDDYGSSIGVDASGNVYTAGRFNDIVDFDPGPGVNNLSSLGGTDAFIQKMDANGNFVWAKSFGGSTDDRAFSIALDASGSVYTTGFYAGITDFDPGNGIYNMTPVGGLDGFVHKMDANGNFIWANSFAGASTEYGFCIAVGSTGNIHTVGNFRTTVDFDPGPGISNLTSVGGFDVFVQKLSQTPVSVKDLKNDLNVLAYPNPSEGIVHVRFPQAPDKVEITLTDMPGKIISTRTYQTLSDISLELPDANGIYFLTLSTSTGRRTLRITKQ